MPVEALFDISEPGESQTKQVCKGRAVGIDLGTTNSLVAVVQAGQPICLRDQHGSLLPSVVHYAADGSVVVGQAARGLAAQAPQDTIASVKRFMGRGPRDAEATRRLTPYEFAPGGDSDAVVRFSVLGGRARGHAGGSFGRDLARAQGARRGSAGWCAGRRRDHRAGLFRRRPAPGHARRRPPGGPRGHAAAQRAHGRGAGLWPGQAGRGNLCRVRPGRRHLRHIDPEVGRWRVRGEVHRRRFRLGWRRF